MSLQNNLYELVANGENMFHVRILTSSPIFAGHFPGHPIVPGACLIQIAEELLSSQLTQTVHFTSITNLKFLRPITPDMEIAYRFNDNKVEIGNLDFTEIYAQFKATYMCAHSDL